MLRKKQLGRNWGSRGRAKTSYLKLNSLAGLRGYSRISFHASGGSGFNFSILVSFTRGLSGGLFSCLGVVMASVRHIGEGGNYHDCNDHGATEESNIRVTVHERWTQKSADPIDSIQTLGTK